MFSGRLGTVDGQEFRKGVQVLFGLFGSFGLFW